MKRVGALARYDSDLVTGRGDTPLAEERRQSVMAAYFDPSAAFLVRGVRIERGPVKQAMTPEESNALERREK